MLAGPSGASQFGPGDERAAVPDDSPGGSGTYRGEPQHLGGGSVRHGGGRSHPNRNRKGRVGDELQQLVDVGGEDTGHVELEHHELRAALGGLLDPRQQEVASQGVEGARHLEHVNRGHLLRRG